LVLSVLLHEAGHAVAAVRRGATVGEIRLRALGGHTEINRGGGSDALVALSGPLVNLAVAALLWGTAAPAAAMGVIVAELVLVLATMNLVLGVFNLLPVRPLDGAAALAALRRRGTNRSFPRQRDRQTPQHPAAVLGEHPRVRVPRHHGSGTRRGMSTIPGARLGRGLGAGRGR
jgi:Zn-dependent protease